MNSRNNTAKIADQLLHDIFDDENLKFSYGGKRKGAARPPPVLKSLALPDNQKGAGLISSQSANNILEAQSFGKNVLGKISRTDSSNSILAPSPKPLNVSDFNRISDLMHRVVAVSGQSPTKTSERFFTHGYIPSENPTNVEIAHHMKASQLQTMQESVSLKEIMQEVIHCHDELQGIIINHLQFRKEVCTEVQDINRRYIDLFEQMLSSVLQTQRTKFKSQTSTIEEQNAEIAALKLKLAQETEHTARRIAEIKELKERILEVEDQRSTFQFEINRLQKRVAELNGTESTYQDLADRANAEFKRIIHELKLSQVKDMEDARYKHTLEVKAVQQKLQASEKELMRVKILLEKEEAKNILKGRIDEQSFKRPNRDNECQTEALDNGLFDKRDGWILPISKNAAARNHWRRALNFVHCSSCKGIGKYILVVARTMKAINRGPELLPDPSGMTHFEHKWILPDAYLRFLSNLPKTVEAFNPRSLQWIVRIVTFLFNHKYTVDRQDSSYGYNMQPITEYLIEMFLLKLETRTDAEIGIYRLLVTLREYFKKHPMLLVFARFLGILDETTAEEKYNFRKEEMLNEQALQRKRESELQVLKPRHRNKLKDELKEELAAQQERELRASINSHFVRFVTVSYKKLELDVLGIYLYARKCILFDNYCGVYATAIKEIKSKSKLLLHYSHLLIGNLATENGLESSTSDLNAANADAVHTHIFNVFPRDIPMHMCIGEGCTNWVPIDRAVRVLRVLTEHLPPEDMMAIYHSLEHNAKFLFPDGRLDLPEGMHTLIRSAARLFVHSVSDEGADIGWYDVYETYKNTSMNKLSNPQNKSFHGPMDDHVAPSPTKSKLLPTKCVVNEYIEQKNKSSKADDDSSTAAPTAPEKEPRVIELLDGSLLDLSLNNEDTLKYYNTKHPDIIMVNMDHILQLIVDAMVLKTADVEAKLKNIFIEGDTNKDGVLSFQEFTTIAQKAAPEFSQRKILKMFREALTQGDDCDHIGTDAFLSVCKAYGLVKLVDIDELKKGKLKAISDPPIAPVILYNNETSAETVGIDNEEVNPVIHKVVPALKKKLHLATHQVKLQKVANQALALSRIPITKNKDFPDTPPDSKPNSAVVDQLRSMNLDLPQDTTSADDRVVSTPLMSAPAPDHLSVVVNDGVPKGKKSRVPAPLSHVDVSSLPTEMTPLTRGSSSSLLYNNEAFQLDSSRQTTPELSSYFRSNAGNSSNSANSSRLARYRNSNSNLRLYSDSEDEQDPEVNTRRDPGSKSRETLRSQSRESGESYGRYSEGIARSDGAVVPKKKSAVNMKFRTGTGTGEGVCSKKQQELELTSAAISDGLMNSALFSGNGEVSPVKKIRVATTVRNETGESVVSVNTASLNSAPTVTTIQQQPVDVGQVLKAQHQAVMKNVDIKSLVVNEEASKSTAELFKLQLKQRREARMNSDT